MVEAAKIWQVDFTIHVLRWEKWGIIGGITISWVGQFLNQPACYWGTPIYGTTHMGMDQNLVPLVNIKIACKWMFIQLKMVCIGIDP